MVDRDNAKERTSFKGVVRPLVEEDLGAIKPILETWVIDRDSGQALPDEVEEDLQLMKDSVSGNDTTYLVAELATGQVVGVIGFKVPDNRLLPYTKTPNPTELVNAYVSKEHRGGKGVGTALLAKLEEEAKAKGHTEVILNSGPRYKDTAWGFYIRTYGKPVGIAEKYYGEGGDAPIWRKEL